MKKILFAYLLLATSGLAFGETPSDKIPLAVLRTICLSHLVPAPPNDPTPHYEADFVAQCQTIDAQVKERTPADLKAQHDADLKALHGVLAK